MFSLAYYSNTEGILNADDICWVQSHLLSYLMVLNTFSPCQIFDLGF